MGFLQDLQQRISGTNRRVEIPPMWFYAKAMSEQDIETLAKICVLCEPDIRKSYNRYFYYIPNEKDFDTAEDIFSRNGMRAHRYNSHIMGDRRIEVLRIGYKWCANQNVLYDNACRIRQKCLERFSLASRVKK